MDPLIQLKLAARRLAILDADGFRMVYQLRRIDPMVLLREGFASIPGLAEVASAGDDALRDLEKNQRMNDAKTDEERAQVQAQLEDRARQVFQAQIAAVEQDPGKLGKLIDQLGTALGHGIDACGFARETLEDGTPIPEGLVDPALTPADICIPFSLSPDGPMDQLLRPVKLVREVTGPNQLAIADLGPEVAMQLAGLIGSAFSGGGKVARTFRGKPGARGAAGHMGEAVQASPKRVPPADRGGARAGARGPDGRKSRGRKASK
jgi:hypothetical protein